MKVYLAAAFTERKRIEELSRELESLGIHTTNQWQFEPSDAPELNYAQYAKADRDGIKAADWLVVFTDKPSTHGGYHWETGYACALDKQILIVGPRTNIFHHLAELFRVSTWEQARRVLVAWRDGK